MSLKVESFPHPGAIWSAQCLWRANGKSGPLTKLFSEGCNGKSTGSVSNSSVAAVAFGRETEESGSRVKELRTSPPVTHQPCSGVKLKPTVESSGDVRDPFTLTWSVRTADASDLPWFRTTNSSPLQPWVVGRPVSSKIKCWFQHRILLSSAAKDWFKQSRCCQGTLGFELTVFIAKVLSSPYWALTILSSPFL